MIGFEGVVEDINDTKGANRVRVRILGIHTNDKSLIPTDTMPWSFVGMSTDNAGMSGIGNSPHGIKQGSTVSGYFRDGADMQQPLITHVILGIPEDDADPSKGFNDPDGDHPRKSGEPDVNRLARGDTSDTVIEKNNASLDKGVTEYGGGTWDEPESPYAAKYPFNKVHESESGHVHEIDDTSGAERLNTRHKSGTGTEIHPDGTEVHRIIGDGYAIYAKDNKVHVKGECSITVDNDCKLNVGGNILFAAPKMDFGESGLEPLVMGNKLSAWIANIVAWANSHTHTGNLGSPTSPPLAPAEEEDVNSKKNQTQ